MIQKPNNNELEDLELLIVCKNCNSLAIMEVIGEDQASLDMCENCGVVNYTRIIAEDEYETFENGKVA